jgi:hypothetical protein
MDGLISSTSLIAAAFGPGVASRVRATLGPAYARDPASLGAVERVGYPQPQDTVELSGQAEPGETATTPEEQKDVQKLKKQDADVRRHEQAHIAAGGQYVQGGATYEYETGPDGRQYADGGEVNVDTSEVPNDPAATIRKMQTVRRAALAPSDPSSQDRAIAAKAQQIESKAWSELLKQSLQPEEAGEKPAAPDDDRAVRQAERAEPRAASEAASPDYGGSLLTFEPAGNPAWANRAGRSDAGVASKPPPKKLTDATSSSPVAARRYASLDSKGAGLDLVA